jgi:hypothetical protein
MELPVFDFVSKDWVRRSQGVSDDPKVIYALLEENDVSELRLFLDLVTMDDKAPLFSGSFLHPSQVSRSLSQLIALPLGHFNRICNLDAKELQFEIRETLANCRPIAFRPYALLLVLLVLVLSATTSKRLLGTTSGFTPIESSLRR